MLFHHRHFYLHCSFNLDLGEPKREKEMDEASFLFSQYQYCYSRKSLVISHDFTLFDRNSSAVCYKNNLQLIW